MSNHVSNIQYLYNWLDGQKVMLSSSLNFHFVANSIPIFEGWEFPGCSSTTGRNPGEGWVEKMLLRVWEFKIATIWTKDQKGKNYLKTESWKSAEGPLNSAAPWSVDVCEDTIRSRKNTHPKGMENTVESFHRAWNHRHIVPTTVLRLEGKKKKTTHNSWGIR